MSVRKLEAYQYLFVDHLVCWVYENGNERWLSNWSIVFLIQWFSQFICECMNEWLEGARESAYLRQVQWFKHYYCEM